MIAVQINSFGGYEALSINNSVPIPVPSPNQVLVEVFAASLNPVAKAMVVGNMKDRITLPATLGGDFSGVIVEVGEMVSDFKISDRVCSLIN